MEDDKYPIEDKALHGPQSIPGSISNTEAGGYEDSSYFFINGKPKPLNIDKYLEKVSSFISEDEFIS